MAAQRVLATAFGSATFSCNWMANSEFVLRILEWTMSVGDGEWALID